MTNVEYSGYDRLADAIILQACEDYKEAFLGKNVDHRPKEKVMVECLNFFESDWFSTLAQGKYSQEDVVWRCQLSALQDLSNELELKLDNTKSFEELKSLEEQQKEVKKKIYELESKYLRV